MWCFCLYCGACKCQRPWHFTWFSMFANKSVKSCKHTMMLSIETGRYQYSSEMRSGDCQDMTVYRCLHGRALLYLADHLISASDAAPRHMPSLSTICQPEPSHCASLSTQQVRLSGSDVNKDLGLKAKAKAKDSDPKAKAKAKDLGLKAKAKDPKYQGHIFHRSSSYSAHHFFIVSVV